MSYQLFQGDCLEVMRTLPAASVQCCITSPPYYGLRDYGIDGQIGLEESPEEYVTKLVAVFREVRRLLRPDGTLWLNLGDSYAGAANSGGANQNAGGYAYRIQGMPAKKGAGIKAKDLIGIPWAVAFALRSDGWWLRSEIIWHKKAPMPESVTDRPTKAHEQLFLLAKSEKYFYDADAIAEPAQEWSGRAATFAPSGAVSEHILPRQSAAQHRADRTDRVSGSSRNRRSVWTLGPEPYGEAHFATMPPKLVEPCILAGSAAGDTVLDPFNGSGTTGAVALQHHRRYIGIELNPDYIELSHRRIAQRQPMLLEVAP